MHPITLDADPRHIAAALEFLHPGSGAGLMRIDGVLHLVRWPDGLAIPTDQAIAQAIQDWQVNQDQERQDTIALRQQIRQTAQSAVGVRVDLLTAAQVRALFAILLFREGALDRTGAVRPLAQWVRD